MSKKNDELENLKISINQLRIYLDNQYELNIETIKMIKDLLLLCLDSPNEAIKYCEGDLLLLILILEDRNLGIEINLLLKELRAKTIRALKSEQRIIRGNDNTDILKDKRDSEGYITDLTLLKQPYETRKIIHDNDYEEKYTEEIYIDNYGRYFRKVYKHVAEDEDTSTEEAIAAEILKNFE